MKYFSIYGGPLNILLDNWGAVKLNKLRTTGVEDITNILMREF